MAEMIKAFVSSTFEDLKLHRAQVVEQLRNLGVFVDPMENWASSKDEPQEFSQRRLDGCHLCILLVAFRRGFIPEDANESITQMEYHAALKNGIVVLPFMLKDDVQSWPPRFCENDPSIRHWRDHLRKKHGVGWFTEDPRSLDIGPSVIRWLMERTAKLQQERSAADPPVKLKTSKSKKTGDGWHNLGDFEVRLQGIFDRHSYPAEEVDNDSLIAHLLVEATVRRTNHAAALDVPAEIGLILDVSGSMRKDNRYGMLEQAVAEFLKQLGAKDRAAIVIFSTTAETIAEFASAAELRRDLPKLVARMRNSPALYGLKTNLAPALTEALALFQDSPTAKQAVKRLYVLTDGGFHDAREAKDLLPQVGSLGAEIGIYAFGTDVNPDQLKRLLRGQRGGWVKPILKPDDIKDSFAHIAAVSQALVGQEGRLFIDFGPEITPQDAWAFRPYEQYFGAIKKRRGNCDVGPPEAERAYSMLFEIRLPEHAGPETPVAKIGFVWRNGQRALQHHEDISVERNDGSLIHSADESNRCRQAYLVLDGMRHALNDEEQLAAEKAKLKIAEYEGRSAELIRMLKKSIAKRELELGMLQVSEDEVSLSTEDWTAEDRLMKKADWESGVKMAPGDSDHEIKLSQSSEDDDGIRLAADDEFDLELPSDDAEETL